MTKEKILISTLELAYEHGLGSVSMSQIAERTGIRKASLYAHYKSKEEIINTMYEYFRNKAKESQRSTQVIDYKQLCKGKSLKEVLFDVVASYRSLNRDPHLSMFYKVVMGERVNNPLAASIMVLETNKMVQSTKELFTKLNELGVSKFDNVSSQSLMFAHAVHSIIDFENDCISISSNASSGNMEDFINSFASLYGKE